jgi:hypothetical protein
MKIFGFELKREPKQEFQTIAPPPNEAGAVDITAGAAYGTYIDLQGTIKNEAELINRYRQMLMHAEVEWAVQQITNEAIIDDDNQETVDLNLDDLEEDGLNEKIMDAIQDEFVEAKRLLEFKDKCHDIFTRYYVDGRLNYHVIIDHKKPKDGIQELRYIDPRKIRKIREIKQRIDNPQNAQMSGAEITSDVKQEYYVYNPQGFSANQYMTGYQYSPPTQGIKIATDAVVQITSGKTDQSGSMVLSNLHKAIKPLNQFSSLEDAAIIYRMARAPERRIFYIDVGGLPRHKAEAYIRDMMQRYKNRLVYDQATGETRDDRKFPTMLEDFWFPRRGDNKATEIDVLPPGQSQGILEELEFFLQKLLAALNVPYGRSHPEDNFPMGATATEITRDEVDFAKFIDNVRLKFTHLFLEIMKRNLALKNIMDVDTFEQIQDKIKFKWAKDNVYAEIKERESLNEKVNTLTAMIPFIGKVWSWQWVMKTVLGMTDDEIEEMRDEILEEMDDPILTPMQVGGDEGLGGPGFAGEDPMDPMGQMGGGMQPGMRPAPPKKPNAPQEPKKAIEKNNGPKKAGKASKKITETRKSRMITHRRVINEAFTQARTQQFDNMKRWVFNK